MGNFPNTSTVTSNNVTKLEPFLQAFPNHGVQYAVDDWQASPDMWNPTVFSPNDEIIRNRVYTYPLCPQQQQQHHYQQQQQQMLDQQYKVPIQQQQEQLPQQPNVEQRFDVLYQQQHQQQIPQQPNIELQYNVTYQQQQQQQYQHFEHNLQMTFPYQQRQQQPNQYFEACNDHQISIATGLSTSPAHKSFCEKLLADSKAKKKLLRCANLFLSSTF
jgi:hypothetical protein